MAKMQARTRREETGSRERNPRSIPSVSIESDELSQEEKKKIQILQDVSSKLMAEDDREAETIANLYYISAYIYYRRRNIAEAYKNMYLSVQLQKQINSSSHLEEDLKTLDDWKDKYIEKFKEENVAYSYSEIASDIQKVLLHNYIKIAEVYRNFTKIIVGLSEITNALDIDLKGNQHNSVDYYDIALRLLEEVDDREQLIAVHRKLAEIYQDFGRKEDYEKAKAHYKSALSKSESIVEADDIKLKIRWLERKIESFSDNSFPMLRLDYISILRNDKKKQMEFVNQLLKVECIANREQRNLVLVYMPQKIKQGYKTDPRDNSECCYIVQACLDYVGGIAILINRIHWLSGGIENVGVKALHKWLKENNLGQIIEEASNVTE
ncbi:MAG: hypothetical protein HXX20_16155 [Chloroflexi bacterium]|nr:hypothetical protein [Chloroflexota bacterium]